MKNLKQWAEGVAAICRHLDPANADQSIALSMIQASIIRDTSVTDNLTEITTYKSGNPLVDTINTIHALTKQISDDDLMRLLMIFSTPPTRANYFDYKIQWDILKAFSVARNALGAVVTMEAHRRSFFGGNHP